MTSRYITHLEVLAAAKRLALRMIEQGMEGRRVYPVPRGGVPALYVLSNYISLQVVDSPEEAELFVDDLIDSGATVLRYGRDYGNKPFYSLFSKEGTDWLIFPWEGNEQSSAADIPRRLLQYIGEDPNRGGLRETPKRFLKAWKDWTSGYALNPADVLKTFEDGAERVDEMVLVANIPVASKCEHHMADIWGLAHIGYIPNGKVVGLSKLKRLVDVFGRRLQVQERLTVQIADAITEHLAPLGVGVVLQCRHMCMESRGITTRGSVTTTSAMRGLLKDDIAARAEFFGLIEGSRNGTPI